MNNNLKYINTMKKIVGIAFVFVMLFISGGFLKAQGKYGKDSAQCIRYLSYYKEYFKQKNYDDALRKLIAKNASNEEYKKALVDTLMKLHEDRAEYYPKYAVTALNNKGTDLANYIKDDDAALYRELSDIIKRNNGQTKGSILLFNLNAAISLYQSGKLEAEEVINTYQKNLAIIDRDMKPLRTILSLFPI